MAFDATAELRRLLDRGSGHRELRSHLASVTTAVEKLWETPILFWYTDHGPEHSRRTADIALQIVQFPDFGENVRLNVVGSAQTLVDT